MNEAAVLQYDVFAGDFGEPGDKVLSNKMVSARKEHKCSHCDQTILKGERHRFQSGVFGEFMTHRWCAVCCEAMTRDDGSFESRAAR